MNPYSLSRNRSWCETGRFFRKWLGCLLISIYSCIQLVNAAVPAGSDSARFLKEDVDGLVSQSSEKGFIENKGQFADFSGKNVDFVLFKLEKSGINWWITEKGITIQTIRWHKEDLQGAELDVWNARGGKRSGHKKNKKIAEWERIDIALKGASIRKENCIGELPVDGHSNYFLPNCQQGIYEAKSYNKLTIRNVYPGIDWVIYQQENGQVKYDFIVSKTADYRIIELIYTTRNPLLLTREGGLQLTTDYGTIQEKKPVSFYEENRLETEFAQQSSKVIQCGADDGFETTLRFNVSQLPKNRTSDLIIDPELIWCSLFGGNGYDGPMAIDVDQSGSIFISGYTGSFNFPQVNPGNGAYFQGFFAGGLDVFTLKFNAAGSLLWSTLYGGTTYDYGISQVIDDFGNLYITGYTLSSNFPLQDPGGGAYFQIANVSGSGLEEADAFILKFDNNGFRQWATYFGGSESDYGESVAVDDAGNLFVSGYARSVDFPLLDPGGGAYFQGPNAGIGKAYLLKFDMNGVLFWSTLYGGNVFDKGHAVHVDKNNEVYMTGAANPAVPLLNPGGGAYFQSNGTGFEDAFLLKFTNSGTLLWATLLGGSDIDEGFALASDAMGNVFVSGVTASNDFPLLDAGGGAYFQPVNNVAISAYDFFIAKFGINGEQLWTTYFGGNGSEYSEALNQLVVDECNRVHMTFNTTSDNIFMANCDDGFQNTTPNNGDVVYTSFSNKGVLRWATYFGGEGQDFRAPIAVDQNNLYTSGEICATPPGVQPNMATYPLLNPGGGSYFDDTFNGGDEDGYITKFVFETPAFDTTITQATCLTGGTASINVTDLCLPVDYIWSNGVTVLNSFDTINTVSGLAPGTYTVQVVTDCDTLEATFVITNNCPFTVADFIASDLTICEGESITFTDNSIAPSPLNSWNWTFNGGIPGTANTQGPHTVTFPVLGVYNITLSASDGQTTDDTTVAVTVVAGFDITVDSDTICQGESTLLTANGADSFTWSPANSLSGNTGVEVIASPVFTQIYLVTGTIGGCTDTALAVVTVIQPPVASITVSPVPVLSSDPVVTFSTQNTAVVGWYQDNELLSTLNEFTLALSDTVTEITVLLVVENELGCLDSAFITIVIQQDVIFYVPNAFTPNGDDFNNVFVPVITSGIDTKGYEFIIFNRWGELVFESGEIGEGWNGTYAGKLVQDGVYTWYLAFKSDYNDGVFEYTGHVNVLR